MKRTSMRTKVVSIVAALALAMGLLPAFGSIAAAEEQQVPTDVDGSTLTTADTCPDQTNDGDSVSADPAEPVEAQNLAEDASPGGTVGTDADDLEVDIGADEAATVDSEDTPANEEPVEETIIVTDDVNETEDGQVLETTASYYSLRVTNTTGHGQIRLGGYTNPGSIAISPGASVTIRCIPESGYVFDRFSVEYSTPVPKSVVDVDTSGTGTVTFTMPDANLTLSVGFVPESEYVKLEYDFNGGRRGPDFGSAATLLPKGWHHNLVMGSTITDADAAEGHVIEPDGMLFAGYEVNGTRYMLGEPTPEITLDEDTVIRYLWKEDPNPTYRVNVTVIPDHAVIRGTATINGEAVETLRLPAGTPVYIDMQSESSYWLFDSRNSHVEWSSLGSDDLSIYAKDDGTARIAFTMPPCTVNVNVRFANIGVYPYVYLNYDLNGASPGIYYPGDKVIMAQGSSMSFAGPDGRVTAESAPPSTFAVAPAGMIYDGFELDGYAYHVGGLAPQYNYNPPVPRGVVLAYHDMFVKFLWKADPNQPSSDDGGTGQDDGSGGSGSGQGSGTGGGAGSTGGNTSGAGGSGAGGAFGQPGAGGSSPVGGTSGAAAQNTVINAWTGTPVVMTTPVATTIDEAANPAAAGTDRIVRSVSYSDTNLSAVPFLVAAIVAAAIVVIAVFRRKRDDEEGA